MDILSYYYGSTEEQPAIPAVNKKGFSSPFNNILYIFQNFDFEKFSELFHRNFNSEKSNDHLIEFAMRVLGLDHFTSYEAEVLPYEQGFILKWDNESSNSPNMMRVNPVIIAHDIFSTELGASKKVFMAKDKSLPEPHMKKAYYLAVFQHLDQILNLFYSNRENYKPFENELGRFFYELYDLTYPYFTQDSDLHYLQRVFDNIKNQNSKPALNGKSSPIEKTVDMLIAEGDLYRQSRNDLIAYLEDGIYKDATQDSVRWLGTADSFTQFIFALVQIGQYKQPGNIKWRHWYKVIRFPGGKTIENDTLKKSYHNAKKNLQGNPYINKIKQVVASSLS